MNITLTEIKRAPKLANFRYDVRIKNVDGEDEELLGMLSSKIVETNESITINFVIPSDISTSWMASMVASLPSLGTIIVDHMTEMGNIAYKTMHRITNYLGWKTVVTANADNLLELEVSYLSEVSFPITQSEEGLNEWLKNLKKEEK